MTAYRIFEKPADSDGDGYETRVYVGDDAEQQAQAHIDENTDPQLKRWVVAED